MTTRYVIIFITILTAVVALMLTGYRQFTKDNADLNEDIFNKRAILLAVQDYLGEGLKVDDLSNQEVLDIFDKQIEQKVINMQGQEVPGQKAEDVDMAQERKKPESDRLLPLFIFNKDGQKYYIISVRGNGLWDEIWGNIALKSDLETIAGASFDHKGETPGLGAEIKDNPAFPGQFPGKKLYDEKGKYISVKVRKGGAVDKTHEVDGITGATITSDGVTEMLYRGIKYYEPYFNDLRQAQSTSTGMLINQ